MLQPRRARAEQAPQPLTGPPVAGRSLMKQHWAVLVAAFALAATQLAQAQSSNHGAIAGTVTDPSGGVIPGVHIEVQNLGTGVTRTVESNEQGHYRVDFLIPGQYILRAELAGFKKIEMPNLTV